MRKFLNYLFLFLSMLLLTLLSFSCHKDEDKKIEEKLEGKFLLKSPEGCTIYRLYDPENNNHSGHKYIYFTVCPDSINSSITR